MSDCVLELRQSAGPTLLLENGRSLLFLTLTMPHDMGDKLSATWDTIAEAWRHIIGGRQGQALRDDYGVVGKITAREVTWSPANGWHPHIHVLLFVDQVLGDDKLDALRASIYARWSKFINTRGFRSPSVRHGVDLQRVENEEALAAYLAKAAGVDGGGEWGVGRELTRADLKRGSGSSVSPWELLGLAMRDGDAGALRLWSEYERVTAGRQQITWSAYLKAAVRVVEVTDSEIAEEDQGGEVVATFGGDLWRWMCQQRGLRGAVLEVAPAGWWAIRCELAQAGAGYLLELLNRPPDRPPG